MLCPSLRKDGSIDGGLRASLQTNKRKGKVNKYRKGTLKLKKMLSIKSLFVLNQSIKLSLFPLFLPPIVKKGRKLGCRKLLLQRKEELCCASILQDCTTSLQPWTTRILGIRIALLLPAKPISMRRFAEKEKPGFKHSTQHTRTILVLSGQKSKMAEEDPLIQIQSRVDRDSLRVHNANTAASGTSWLSSSSIIVANMLGAGVLGLPNATKNMGITLSCLFIVIITCAR